MEDVPRRRWVEQVMGLPVSVLARGPRAGDPAADEAVAALYAQLHEVDALFSPYRDDSDVSRVSAGDLPLHEADALVRDVAARCESWRRRTHGVFDPRTPAGRWDPSGLVKGWAVERAASTLPTEGVDWCVNGGGDVVVVGRTGEPFRVAVEDPADRSALVAVVPVASGGVATSGTAARGQHLYDPRTGEPAGGLASVTVVGPSLEVADVLATVCFVAAGTELLEPGYEALCVLPDGSLRATPGWPRG